MRPRSANTIAAIATAPGRGGVGVVRVSGDLAESICLGVAGAVAVPRRASFRSFGDAEGRTIDAGLVLFFPPPGSYTGEPVVEFQGHGSPQALAALLDRCIELGARIARPGEFTERAFLNDRLDLAQAEAVADLIDAESRTAARAAIRSLSGEFSNAIRDLVAQLESLRIMVEAAIDFPEEDIDVMADYQIGERVQGLMELLDGIFSRARHGQRLREGATVVLLGEPNVGKSSLLNRLAGEDLAIVTDVPGTTRDPIRGHITLDGVPFHLIDTAGLRESADAVEREGIARSRAQASKADLAVLVLDARENADAGVARVAANASLPERCIVVRNKIDLIGESASSMERAGMTTVSVSAQAGEGLSLLREALLKAVDWEAGGGEGAFTARSRHLEALRRCREHLQTALRLIDVQTDLVAEELRYAMDAAGEITGRKTADDLLGAIFASFCIGK